MDQSLYEASQAGNTLLLLRRNMNVYDASSVNNKGINIVKLNKPCFAELRNHDGFTSMHVACANGYLDIVKELLHQVGPRVCHLRGGRGDWTPLHCAAISGRLEILREIISACPESVEDVTLRGETALYLAAKNNQVEAIQVLVELVVNSPVITMGTKKKILNMKNAMGIPVLHLTVSKRQHHAVRCLVRSTGLVELNHVIHENESRLTALDLLLRLPKISKSSYADDKETERILRGAGALTGDVALHFSDMATKTEASQHGLRYRASRPRQLSAVY